VVVTQQFVQKVDSLVAHKALVFRGDEAVPLLLGEPPNDVVVLGVKFYLVLVQVVEEVVGAEYFGDFDKLIRVALPVEEWLLSEDHRREHGSKTPHVQTVVVLLEINEQLWALEISTRHTYVILGSRMIELGQAPVDEAKLRQGGQWLLAVHIP
jgi:hypothetical protein